MEAQGIEKPRQDEFSREVLDQMDEARSKAKAAIAELEILHRDRLAALAADPAAIREEEEDYRRERLRIEEKRDRTIEKLRGQG